MIVSRILIFLTASIRLIGGLHAGYIPAITLVTKAITIEIPTSDIEKSGRMTISKFEPLLEPALNGIPFMSNNMYPQKLMLVLLFLRLLL